MLETLLIVHIIICIALIGAILMQRSEGGGALGIGGGPSGIMSGRAAASFMTRTTGGLALLFFLTSIGLTILSGQGKTSADSLMVDGRTKDGLPTKSIDLGNATAPVNAATGAIPQSAAAPAASAFETSAIDAEAAKTGNEITNAANAVTNSAKDSK